MLPMLSPGPPEKHGMSLFMITFLATLAAMIAFGISGWLLKWRFLPAWARLGKRRQDKKQRKLNELNAPWRRSRAALSQVKEPLIQFNQMDKFPDIYTPAKCSGLASEIEKAAQELDESSEFVEIKKRLLRYAAQRSYIYGTCPWTIDDLKFLFQKNLGGIFEPLVLWNEAQEVLKRTATPPYSDKDV